MKVAVLGTGPEGLIAAHAATLTGHDVSIYGDTVPEILHGVAYLNQHIPDIGMAENPEALIHHVVMAGDFDFEPDIPLWGLYHQKAGGSAGIAPDPDLEPERLLRNTWASKAQNLRTAYQNLWARYSSGITVGSFGLNKMHPSSPFLVQTLAAYDLVLSTWPRPLWARCEPGVILGQRAAWVITDGGEKSAPLRPEENTIIYEASRDVGFYRAANVFGIASVEWPGEKPKPPVEGVLKMVYPTTIQFLGGHEKPELPFRLEHLGQYAEWSEEINPASVFDRTRGLLDG